MSRTSARFVSCAVALGMAFATLSTGIAGADEGPADAPAGIASKLAGAFRADLSDLQVSYDYWPDEARVDGRAVLRLTMRPDQRRAIFHFNPLRDVGARAERAFLTAVIINGETLDPQDDGDLRLLRPLPSAERAYEVQRDLAPDVEHTLEVRWAMPYEVPSGDYPGWFHPLFDDTVGPRGQTETAWPTVSSPEELVRHRIRLRVHTDEPYTVMGSGVVETVADDGAQSWLVDTVRAVSSSTVFFAAVPAHDVSLATLRVRGVDVTIVSDQAASVVDRAAMITERTIERLVRGLGPFPSPNMQVLLTGWGSGMEYYGATRTGVGSLEHELVHMYFGTATVNRTWRDTWFDEAADEWWLRRDRLRPLPPGFTSDIARGRSVVAPGFDLRAYGLGARILGEVADALGGSEAMIDFLADLHERRAFRPFTTDELIDDIVAAQDQIDREQLEQWLFTEP